MCECLIKNNVQVGAYRVMSEAKVSKRGICEVWQK